MSLLDGGNKTWKVGERVLVCQGGWANTREIAVVEKVGKIHFFVQGQRYRTDGSAAGDNPYNKPHIEKLKAGDEEDIALQARLVKLRATAHEAKDAVRIRDVTDEDKLRAFIDAANALRRT